MAGQIRSGWLDGVISTINRMMVEGDTFSAFKAEYDTFTANSLAVTQKDVNGIFGVHEEGTEPNVVEVPNVSLDEFLAGFNAMNSMVNFMHQPAQANKLYRVKK